ncbi:ECF transporter S component [Ktedonospora formicarum]|nr:ECF transporter S component [Ktedonospora formicarum]
MSTEHSSPPHVPRSQAHVLTWRTRDILVLAALSLVFGLVIIFVSGLYGLLSMAFSHALAGAIFSSFFLIPGLATPYILRRPGAAFLGQVLIGFVQFPFDPGGWTSLTIYIMLGILYELPFLVTRYRNYHLLTLISGGIISNLLVLTIAGLAAGGFHIAPSIIIAAYVLIFVSGTIGPWLAKLLADTIVKTGVLSSYAISDHTEQI